MNTWLRGSALIGLVGFILGLALYAGASRSGAAPVSNQIAAPSDCPPPPAPLPTPEPLWVDPVTSPTTLFTQTIYVTLGRGRIITVVLITFDEYGDESDPGPYPIPPNAPIEGGADSTGDRHVLVLNSGECKLYKLFHARQDQSGPGWTAGSGAVFTMTSNVLRPEGWTLADAAGLPILPGLVRYDKVAAGAINHVVRFTIWRTQRAYIHQLTWAGPGRR